MKGVTLSRHSSSYFLTYSGPHTKREHQASTLEEDCSYLSSLTNEALEEDFRHSLCLFPFLKHESLCL